MQVKLNETQDELIAKTNELEEFQKNASSADPNSDDAFTSLSDGDTSVASPATKYSVVYFKGLRKAAGLTQHDLLIAYDDAFIRNSTDNKYQIAYFSASVPESNGWMAILYRSLPDGVWKNSNFSGQGRGGIAYCRYYTEEELAIFSVVQYDSKEEYMQADGLGGMDNYFICLK